MGRCLQPVLSHTAVTLSKGGIGEEPMKTCAKWQKKMNSKILVRHVLILPLPTRPPMAVLLVGVSMHPSVINGA